MFSVIKNKLGNKAIDKMTEASSELAQSLVNYQMHIEHGNIEMAKIELGRIAGASSSLASSASILKLML